jgi:4-amino-4-deoxy-L-arabinose transferase-like glycosyltransferase
MGGAPARPGGGGGGGGASSADEELVHYLERHQGSSEYLVAVNGSQTAAPFILESGKAVIAMGGFGGTDPAPTLSQFEQLVATGKVHYVYVSSGGAAAGGQTTTTASAVDSWVEKHGTVVSSSAYGGSSGSGTLYYVATSAVTK